MNKKIKTSLLLKITSVAVIWGMIFSQVVFAQCSGFETENLSPALHIQADLFLRIYGKAYSFTPPEDVNVYLSLNEQMTIIESHKQKIVKNLKEYSLDWEHDQKILTTVLKLAEDALKDRKFPAPTNELFLHHAMEVAFYLSQRKAPVESICVAILHRFDEGEIFDLINGQIPKKDVEEIILLTDSFLNIVNFYYEEMPLKKDKHSLQNFMNDVIKKAEIEVDGEIKPDERIIMIALADVLASIKFSSEKERRSLSREIEELWAYLAHRSGLEEMKDELLN